MNQSLIYSLVLTATCTLVAPAQEKDKLPAHALPVVQDWLHQNSEVVEVCVYREEWRAPTNEFRKGKWTWFATITFVHKGTVKVGQRVQMTAYKEYSRSEWKAEAKRDPDRVSMVNGELKVAMFNKKDSALENSYWLIGHDICRFSFNDYFYKAFLIEKKRDPSLNGTSD